MRACMREKGFLGLASGGVRVSVGVCFFLSVSVSVSVSPCERVSVSGSVSVKEWCLRAYVCVRACACVRACVSACMNKCRYDTLKV